MNLSKPFIQRPIGSFMLSMGLIFLGIIAFNVLPVSPIPQIEFPTIMVQALLPGASPEIMAATVTTPLEKQIGRISGVTELTSSSTIGMSRITVQFDLLRNIDGAARDIQSAINAAQSQLPIDMPTRPTYRKINPADAPIMIIALTSKFLNTAELFDVGSSVLAQKLSTIEGVGQVYVGGGSLPAIRVKLNPNSLNQYGISLEEVRRVIRESTVNRPKGKFSWQDKSFVVQANDQMLEVKDYLPLIIRYQNNAPVRLQDVATIEKSEEDKLNAGMSDGNNAILLVLFKQPGFNIIETVDKVKDMFPSLKSIIPENIDLTVTMDRTTTIRSSLFEIEMTLIIAICLVIIIVYLFLLNIRATVIPAIAIILSLLGCFVFMKLFNFTINNLTLMALTIATGFIVDDAIVVLENNIRHLEMGSSPKRASLEGAKEVGFTVLSMSTSLIAVFIPIFFMTGMVGRLFREFSLTLAFVIFVSFIISLTITPMLCAHWLNPKKKFNSFELRLHQFYEVVLQKYKKSLEVVLKHSNLMLLLLALAIILTILLLNIIPKGFFPLQDTGRILVQVQAQQNMSFQFINKKFKQYTDIIQNDPAVEHVSGYITSGRGGNNNGQLYISLKPLKERQNISAQEVIDRLRSKLNVIPGIVLYMQVAQDLVIGGRAAASQYQYTLTADKISSLNEVTPKVLAQLSQLPNLVDANTDQRNHGLEIFVNINHDDKSKLGITTRTINDTLYDAFGQRQIATFYTLLNQYHVVMEVANKFGQNPENLNDSYVPSQTGVLVPLTSFAKFVPGANLLSVNHQSQFPSSTIAFNLASGYSLGQTIEEINRTIENLRLPENIHYAFRGSALAFLESLANQPYLILAAILAIYIVLGILYESLIHPITILSTLPSASLGALIALSLMGYEFNVITFIGIILLIGIVIKNAIMMIDFALHLERNFKISPFESILQGAILRFRPIMITTMTAIFSAFPLAFWSGIGYELRRPLGITIIGGLILSQIMTLYTTPIIYLSLERLRQSMNRSLFRVFNMNNNPMGSLS